MANWCVGDLKVRGKYDDIKRFLSNELSTSSGSKAELREGVNSLSNNADKGLYIERLKTGSFEYGIYIDIDSDDIEEIITANLGELSSRWTLDMSGLVDLSRDYNLDFKIYAYERGMEFNIDFEVHKGVVIKCDEISFDDYVWECHNPSLGG